MFSVVERHLLCIWERISKLVAKKKTWEQIHYISKKIWIVISCDTRGLLWETHWEKSIEVVLFCSVQQPWASAVENIKLCFLNKVCEEPIGMIDSCHSPHPTLKKPNCLSSPFTSISLVVLNSHYPLSKSTQHSYPSLKWTLSNPSQFPSQVKELYSAFTHMPLKTISPLSSCQYYKHLLSIHR